MSFELTWRRSSRTGNNISPKVKSFSSFSQMNERSLSNKFKRQCWANSWKFSFFLMPTIVLPPVALCDLFKSEMFSIGNRIWLGQRFGVSRSEFKSFAALRSLIKSWTIRFKMVNFSSNENCFSESDGKTKCRRWQTIGFSTSSFLNFSK